MVHGPGWEGRSDGAWSGDMIRDQVVHGLGLDQVVHGHQSQVVNGPGWGGGC